MPFYENVFIARQDVTAAQVEALTELFAGIVVAQGGTVPKREYWGLKGLSYRVRKNRKGHYVLMNIDAPAGAVTEMERNMRIHEDVIRHLTVRVDALEEGPSAMLQSKGRDREGRDRDGRDRDGPRRDRDDRPPRGDRDDRPRGDGPRGDGPRGDDRLRPTRPRAVEPVAVEGETA